MEILTYTRGKTFGLCQTKEYWRYERHLAANKEDDGEAIGVGRLAHIGLDAYLQSGDADTGCAAITAAESEAFVAGPDADKLAERAAKARAIVRAAAQRWPHSPAAATATIAEGIVEMPIINPDTGSPSRTFIFKGKADGVIGESMMDWKCVADPLEFIESTSIGNQTELYAAALANEGITIKDAHFRIIRRPTIKFCGKDPTPDDFEERCLQWLLATPGALSEHEMYLNPARIERARQWLWDTSKAILDARRLDRWGTNEMACRTWGRPCEFLPLCMCRANGGNVEDVIRQSYHEQEPHPELVVANRKTALAGASGG